MDRFDTDGPIDAVVDFRFIHADIQVTAGSAREVTIEINPRNPDRARDVKAVELTQLGFADGRLAIRLRPALTSWFTDGGAVEVRLTVPAGSNLDLHTGMGDLRCDGDFGDVRLGSGMGNIRVSSCAGAWVKTGLGDVDVERIERDADLRTGSGDIRVDDIRGAVTTRNGNGNTALGMVGGAVAARSSNGAITVDEPRGDLHARTANGALHVGSVVRGVVTLGTAAGAIDIGVREGTAAWLDVVSKFGRVRNGLTASEGPGSGETAEIRARTSYGDVTIHRSPK